MQENSGSLQIQVTDTSIGMPIPNAKVIIKDESNNTIEELITDNSGQTPIINLPAPNINFSLEENNNSTRPYSIYNLQASSQDYNLKNIIGVQILPRDLAIQEINLERKDKPNQENNIIIQPNTLWGSYDPKIPEDPTKPLNFPSGEVVLNKIVVPEYIVVDDGVPSDSSAKNYYILFKDYIKNVACSDIYSTWPDATLRANILAIISFVLNRVYTEWYRNKGYDFTITSSTAYDHAFFYGRNIYKSISIIVDEMFNTYITKFGIRQPLLAQYCD